MTFLSRRGTFQTKDLQNTSLSLQAHLHIFAHHAADLVIVGTDEGGIFGGVGLAFKHNHGDAFIIGAVDGWGHGGQLVRGYDEQLDAALYETVDLLDLSFGVITGCLESQLHTIVKHALKDHL